MKIEHSNRDGARASARFDAHAEAPWKHFAASLVDTLKRRERRAPGANENGSITFVFIALLAIMMILVTAEGRALYQLHREVKFLEQQQIKRLNLPPTNVVTTVLSEPK